MADDIVKVIADTRTDAATLQTVVNGDENTQVTSRLGESYPSVQKAIKLMTQSGLSFTAFETKALMTASSLANGSYAIVTNDTTTNNGLHIKKSGTWSKVTWDIDERTKSYTDTQITSVTSIANTADNKASSAEQIATTAEQIATTAEQKATTAEQKATTAEQKATTAKAAADALVYSDNNRAGDAVALFSSAIVGEPSPLSASANIVVSEISGVGKVLNVKNKQGYIAARKATAVYPNRNYKADFGIKRIKDPADPSNDTVQTGVEYLAYDKTAIKHLPIENKQLTVSDGVFDVFYNLAVPDGAVYARPWVRIYGEDSETAIIYLDIKDITDANTLDLAIAESATTTLDLAAADATTKSNNAKNQAVAIATDFAATAVADKADKASPTFTGTPTAPTAPFTDRSNQIANTYFAFNLQHGQIIKSVVDDLTLTEEDTHYPTLVLTGTLNKNVNVTVPSLSSSRNWVVRNATVGNYTVTLAGSENSVVLPKGLSTVYSNATSMFINTGADKAKIDSPRFTGTPSAPSISLDYTDPFALVNVTALETLTKKPRTAEVTSPSTTIPSNLSKSPVLFLTGTLTSNTDVFLTLPIGGGHWIIRNATNGNYNLTIHGAIGAGIQINRNELVQIVSNGSSVFKVASSDGAAIPVAPVKPLYQLNATLTAKVPKTIMTSISKDRTHGWGYTSNTLDETWDDGETWDTIHTFSGASIDAVKEMGDGELLIVTAVSGAFRKVWRTVGKDTASMTLVECFTGHAAGVKFTSSWSIFTHENMVFVADYGPKAGSEWSGVEGIVPVGNNARYVRMSLNNGKTWQVIFDLNEFLPSKSYPIEGSHVHGIAYDKWWDRLWLSFGDNAYNIGGVLFSDDFGKTWYWANEGKVDKDNPALSPPNSTCQVVGIIPIEGSILFGTDTSPNGVLKIDRSQGKKLTKYKIEVGFAINNEPMTTHLCQGIYRASDDHPVFFAFGSELTSSPSCIVATWDGDNFVKVWEDTVNQPAGFGLRSVIAPTIRGNLIAAHNDTRISGKWSELKGKAPIY